jgi:DNA-binding CsgD family transcriptional regulator
MEYITVQEAAKKWKISDRLVQKYCAEGRIDGIRKFGKSWGIPSSAVKPQDPRKEKAHSQRSQPAPEVFPEFMPLMNTPFEPGRCLDYINEVEEGPRKEIAFAEYYYFSGQPEKAIQEAELYLTSPNAAHRFSACWIYAYANLSVGQIQHARYALTEIKNTLAANAEKAPYIRSIESFIVFASSVLLHLPLPEKMPPAQKFLPLLPPGLRAFALYVQAHYLYLKEDYGKSVGIVEATLGMGADQYPIPAIYLHLVAVMDYMSLKQTQQAQKHLLSAWEIARPDDLIEGFGEHHGLLGGMLEAVIKPRWPEDFKRIIAITYRFSAGWRKIHNPETGHDVADDLTTTEFATAMLAARGWKNQEIAQHMNISSHTVKRYISAVLQKLGIRQRQELKKYMLK